MKVLTVSFIALLFFTKSSQSQNKDTTLTPLSGSLSVTGLYQSGNTYKFVFQGKGELKRVSKNLETILFGAATYGESKGNKDDNSYYGSLTADLYYHKILSPFALQYIEYNFAKGIDLRSQSGAGLKYLFLPDSKHKSSVSLAFIYDYMKLVNKPGNFESKEWRFSFRIKTRQELFGQRMIINLMMMYQPVFDEFSKANLFILSELEVPITKVLRIVVNYNYGFDNVVSVGRKRADNRLTFGMKLEF